jgi:hypothetical protein
MVSNDGVIFLCHFSEVILFSHKFFNEASIFQRLASLKIVPQGIVPPPIRENNHARPKKSANTTPSAEAITPPSPKISERTTMMRGKCQKRDSENATPSTYTDDSPSIVPPSESQRNTANTTIGTDAVNALPPIPLLGLWELCLRWRTCMRMTAAAADHHQESQ